MFQKCWELTDLHCLIHSSIGSGGAAVQARPALPDLTATQAREVLCSLEVSAVDYNTALLERINDVACLNTFATLDTRKVQLESCSITGIGAIFERQKIINASICLQILQEHAAMHCCAMILNDQTS